MNFNEKLAIRKNNNLIINKLTADVSAVIGKNCWNEFNWRSGKVMGLLRTLLLNRNIPAVFNAAGIEEEIIDCYFDVAGNLPYIDKNGQINIGRPQQPEELIELLQHVYEQFGLVAMDNEFEDITKEHWDSLYSSNMERIRKTLEITSNIQYEE